MALQFRSVARWPLNVGISLDSPNNESSDIHNFSLLARAICARLEREGFGGDGKIFPLETRVEMVLPAHFIHDPTATGHDRITNTLTGRAIVRQPYMTDTAWEMAVEDFINPPPPQCVEVEKDSSIHIRKRRSFNSLTKGAFGGRRRN